MLVCVVALVVVALDVEIGVMLVEEEDVRLAELVDTVEDPREDEIDLLAPLDDEDENRKYAPAATTSTAMTTTTANVELIPFSRSFKIISASGFSNSDKRSP